MIIYVVEHEQNLGPIATSDKNTEYSEKLSPKRGLFRGTFFLCDYMKKDGLHSLFFLCGFWCPFHTSIESLSW